MNVKQVPQRFGLFSAGCLPSTRISGRPTPLNGAAHSRQRGFDGMWR
jgi:hypothetical protein